jgi:hypothetical protein
VAIGAGGLLILIGLRFLFAPETATRGFGLPRGYTGDALAHMVGLRDVWLGALALALAWLKEWRALALWLGMGALICWADAALVIAAGGKAPYIAFHAASGIICAVLARTAWRRWGKSGRQRTA